jgi:hypothetical protein
MSIRRSFWYVIFPEDARSKLTRLQHGDLSSISDLTPANGFNITGCDSAWASGTQKITINCFDRAKCSQLFEGGALDTIVRLPISCGNGPFARISRMEGVVAAGGAGSKKKRDEDYDAWNLELSYDMNREMSTFDASG